MKRTELIRKSPMKRSPSIAKVQKPPKGPKLHKCKVRNCRAEFVKSRPFEDWCSPECGATLAMEKLAKQRAAKAKSERAADRLRRAQGMPINERLEACQKLANRYAVLRDHAYGCISCDKGPWWVGGVWHGSHFKSVGSNSALRFNLLNINKACDQCNFFMAGNIVNYEPRLAQKIGADRVDWLRNHPRSRVYSVEYLMRLMTILRKKIKRQEARVRSYDE